MLGSSRYARGAVLGVAATVLSICTVYVVLVLAGTMNFSGVAFAAAAILSFPGGAVLGLLIASGAEPADDDDDEPLPGGVAQHSSGTTEDHELVRTLVRSDDAPEGVDDAHSGRWRPGPGRAAPDEPPSPPSAASSVSSVAGARRRTRP